MTPIPTILEQLQQHYDDAVATLRADVIGFGKNGTIPPARKRKDGRGRRRSGSEIHARRAIISPRSTTSTIHYLLLILACLFRKASCD